MKKNILIFIVFIFYSIIVNAQLVFEGQVLEQDGTTTIPFVNIIALPSGEGTTTDIDGRFTLRSSKKIRTLNFSFIGFETRVVKVKNESDRNMFITLITSDIKINEAVVFAKKRKIKKDTAAITLYRNVVKHKPENRPKGMDSYHYKEHSKMEFALYKYNPKLSTRWYMQAFRYAFDFADTTRAGNLYVPGLLMEELTEIYYKKKPEKRKKIMLANMATGMDNLSATLILSDVFQRIDMYDNVIEAGGKPFASPFSKTGILTYRYFLSDSTTNEDGVKMYRLDFSPRNKHSIAFNGYAWIENKNFAITEMEFRIPTKANLNFINDFYVNQTFSKPDDKHWFLTAEEMHVSVNPLKTKKGRSILLKKRISRNDIELNVNIPDSIFDGESLIIDDSVATRSRDWWVENRVTELTESEKNIFKVVDSLQNTKTYINLQNAIYASTSGYLRFGKKPPIEIGQFYKFVSWNNIEGIRLKFGARTNKHLTRKVQVTAYGAYATKLAKNREIHDPLSLDPWSYLFNARFMLPRKNHHWHILEFTYSNDFTFLGTTSKEQMFNHDNLFLSLLRTEPLEEIMKIEEYRVQYEKEWVNGFTTDIFASRKTFFPVKNIFEFDRVNYLGDTVSIPKFTNSEMGVTAHFKFGKNYFENEFIRTSAGSKKPQIELTYAFGMKGILGGDYNYHKLKLKWFHRFSHKLGFTRYTIKGGYTFGETPYPLLFMHQGNTNYYYNIRTYSAMQEFEYASDKYAAIWIDHHFDGKILNAIPLVKLLKFRSIFLFKVLWSDIKPANRNLILMPKTLQSTNLEQDKVFVELGFGIENIIKLFRVDFVWRMTQVDLLNNYSNVKTIQGVPVDRFTIKFAVQPKL